MAGVKTSDQLAKFQCVARELSADQSPDALDRGMDRRDIRAKPKDERQDKKPSSQGE